MATVLWAVAGKYAPRLPVAHLAHSDPPVGRMARQPVCAVVLSHRFDVSLASNRLFVSVRDLLGLLLRSLLLRTLLLGRLLLGHDWPP